MKNNILKSIFVTILLLLGASHAAFAYDWEVDKTLYFDNSVTQWSEVYVIIGKSGYNRAYRMEAVANTTLYKYTMSPKWAGYTEFVIASTIGGSSTDENSEKNKTSIGTAYSSCESRINTVSQNISADVLIKVTGNTSPYSRDILTSFDLNDYSTTNKLPSANGEVSNLIIFNTSTATKSAWLWKDNGSGTLHNTIVSGTANSTTLSFYNNVKNDYNKAIGFVEAGTEGSTSFPNITRSTADKDIDGSSCTSDNLYCLKKAEKFVDFVHLGATFEVSSTSPSTNTTITLTATPNANATLYKDAGNSAKYAFYVEDAESNITCLSSFSTTNSISYTTPSTAQTITLYCYVRDLYGLETIQYSREINVSSPCTTPTIEWTTAPANGTVGGSMTATVSPNQTSPTITWNSSNTSVATVDNNGKITYKAAGTTTITASYTGDGTTYCAEKVSVSKEITVKEAPKWQIKGSWDNWIVYNFTDNGDNTCSWSTELAENKDYQFVIFQGDTYYKGGTINSKSNQNISLKENDDGNNSITSSTSGTYTFIWNYNTKTISVTYPTVTTITSYTVAGTSSTVFGTQNCETCTEHDMVKQSDGTYKLTIQNKYLTAYTRQCYFVGNHSASTWRYPATNDTYIDYKNNTEGDYDITFILNPSVPSAEVILTQIVSTYTVSFNYNGGSGTTSSLSCDKGGSITLPTPDTREGYTFDGWYTAATDGTLAGAAGKTYTPHSLRQMDGGGYLFLLPR